MFPSLDLLEKYLNYNILDQPFWKVPSIQAEVQAACVQWIPSICTAADASEAKARAEKFSFNHMLHWLEAMSIMGDTKIVLPSLNILLGWFIVRLLHIFSSFQSLTHLIEFTRG